MLAMLLERCGDREAADRPIGRVTYRIQRGRARFLVIADFLDDGSYTFAESEGDEPRWHPFRPSEEEVREARRWLAGA